MLHCCPIASVLPQFLDNTKYPGLVPGVVLVRLVIVNIAVPLLVRVTVPEPQVELPQPRADVIGQGV